MSMLLALSHAIVLLRQTLLNSPFFHVFFPFQSLSFLYKSRFLPICPLFPPSWLISTSHFFSLSLSFCQVFFDVIFCYFNSSFPGLNPPLTQCPLPLQTERTIWSKISSKSNFSPSSAACGTLCPRTVLAALQEFQNRVKAALSLVPCNSWPIWSDLPPRQFGHRAPQAKYSSRAAFPSGTSRLSLSSPAVKKQLFPRCHAGCRQQTLGHFFSMEWE